MLPVTRNEAIRVSSSRLTCAIEEPKMPGSMSLPMRRTPSAAGRQRGHESRPSRATDGSMNTSCTTPDTNTPMASTTPGLSEPAAMTTANRIITRFMSTCVKAGTAKRP